MPLCSLKPVLAQARARGGACLGLVCLGWEDVQAFVAAAEAAQVPAILSAGPGARAHMPLSLWGAMFDTLGKAASVPVVAHLDHATRLDECEAALAAGFTSLMIDGSLLPLAENIALCQSVCRLVEGREVSVEAELGQVGYEGGVASQGTPPQEVRTFLREVPCDALAISIGNSHLQTKGQAAIDFELAAQIAAVADRPLVLHGSSGVRLADRQRLAADFGVHKFNVGTEFRQVFGQSLRQTLADQPALFDRLKILAASRDAMAAAVQEALETAWTPSS